MTILRRDGYHQQTQHKQRKPQHTTVGSVIDAMVHERCICVPEVLSCLGDHISMQFDGEPAERLISHSDIHEDPGVVHDSRSTEAAAVG